MLFDMIVATDMHWGIGKNNNLLTSIPEDMKFFRNITQQRYVVMGRNTKESLPLGFLDQRQNIVISKQLYEKKNNKKEHINQSTSIIYYPNIESFVNDVLTTNSYRGVRPIIIGGGQIYKEFLDRDLVGRIFLTVINNIYDADTFIPNVYDYGFRYDPSHPLNIVTGYENEYVSTNNKDKFTIKTLIK